MAARTDFRVVERAADGNWILEAKPQNGRTHQIRVHAWHLGLPIVGDELYLPNRQRCGELSESQVMCLHAAEIEFQHPVHGQSVRFTAARPAW